MEEERKVLIGDKLPEIKAKTTHGEINLPEDYKGKWLILFSHPADFTPVCTTEFVAFQKRYDDFKKLNTELVGLSIDQVFSHIKWVEWIEENLDTEIEFPIIADDTGNISKKLGFIHPNKGTDTVRAVLIVDPQSTVRAILYYPQELGRNMDEFLRMIEAFQVGAKNKAAMPANWPDNELIKDRVIVPPAKSIQNARKRKEKYECYDWWLCHKEAEK